MEIDKHKALIAQICDSLAETSVNLKVLLNVKNDMLQELESLKDYHRSIYFRSINNELSEQEAKEYAELHEHVYKLAELIKQLDVRIESVSKFKTVSMLISLDADAIFHTFTMALDRAANHKYIINHWLNIIQDQQKAFEEMRVELISIESEIEPEVYKGASNNLEILVKLYDQMKDKFNQLSQSKT